MVITIKPAAMTAVHDAGHISWGGCGKAADGWRKWECTDAVLGGPSSKAPFLHCFSADEHRRI